MDDSQKIRVGVDTWNFLHQENERLRLENEELRKRLETVRELHDKLAKSGDEDNERLQQEIIRLRLENEHFRFEIQQRRLAGLKQITAETERLGLYEPIDEILAAKAVAKAAVLAVGRQQLTAELIDAVAAWTKMVGGGSHEMPDPCDAGTVGRHLRGSHVVDDCLTRASDDGPCGFCGQPTDSLSVNPSRWPLVFPHPGDDGKPRFHHVQCVTDRLFLMTRIKPRIRERLQHILARPEMWGVVTSLSLETLVIQFLEVYRLDIPKTDGPPFEHSLFNRYRAFTCGMKGKPDNVPLSYVMDLSEITPILQRFIEQETSEG